MSSVPYVILDLDNCIADDAWRIPRINWQKADPFERYHDYHLLSGFDAVGNEHLLEGVRAGRERAIVFTARPVAYQAVTEEWLRRRGVPCARLIMRNNNDHRPSVELKRKMLHWLPELYDVPWSAVSAAYDDRPDVVSMYREHDIQAHLAAIHAVCAYTQPNQPGGNK